MRTEHTIGFVIIALLIVDVFLMWKMVYGAYPWEAGSAGA